MRKRIKAQKMKLIKTMQGCELFFYFYFYFCRLMMVVVFFVFVSGMRRIYIIVDAESAPSAVHVLHPTPPLASRRVPFAHTSMYHFDNAIFISFLSDIL